MSRVSWIIESASKHSISLSIDGDSPKLERANVSTSTSADGIKIAFDVLERFVSVDGQRVIPSGQDGSGSQSQHRI